MSWSEPDMERQYSFSIYRPDGPRRAAALCLAIDSGSPVVSVAIGVGTEIRAVHSNRDRNASGTLLTMVDAALEEAEARPRDIELLLGIRGPGSFTGLRVGLATLQGLHLVLEVPVATWTTFDVLASLAPDDDRPILACVDALRDHWLVQRFAPDDRNCPPDAPVLRSTRELLDAGEVHLVGFGVSDLCPTADSATGPNRIEPGPLAPLALQLLARRVPDFDPGHLAHPLYLRPPAARPPSPQPA